MTLSEEEIGKKLFSLSKKVLNLMAILVLLVLLKIRKREGNLEEADEVYRKGKWI